MWALEGLCESLAQRAERLDETVDWPRESLEDCAAAGVFRWFWDEAAGAPARTDAELTEVYVRLASACLTTTFVITQRQAACARLAASANETLKQRYLPELSAGRSFTTVGISHLSTSRRHLARPVLAATCDQGDFCLNGYSPWVTGAAYAEFLVVGAQLETGAQILIAVPTSTRGVEIEPAARLVALSASHTALVRFQDVRLGAEWLIAGPMDQAMQFGGGGTGGLQTSALATGLSRAALDYLRREAGTRHELALVCDAFDEEWSGLYEDLMALAQGHAGPAKEDLRARANSLALRSTQAALAAAKGAGYLAGHPVGRWCREALFFLVWSCPHGVAQSNLCEFAGLATDG